MIRSKNLIMIILAACLFLWSQHGFSQDNSTVTPDEMYRRYLDTALSGKVMSLIKGGIMMTVNWMADGNSFWYAEGAPENTVIYKYDPKKKSKKPLFDTGRLRKAIAEKLREEPPYQGLPFMQFEFVEGEKKAKFVVGGKELICDLKTYEIEEAPPISAEAKEKKKRMTPKSFKFILGYMTEELLSPDEKFFAGIKDNNLYIRSTADDSITMLTDDGLEKYGWDMWNASPAWSPDSSRLAITKIDARKMDSIPLVNWLDDDEKVIQQPYSRAGRPLWNTEFYVVNLATKERTPIDTGDLNDKFVSIICWFPDGSELIFSRVDREFKRLDLMAANPATGETRIVLTETQKTQLNYDPFGKISLPLLEDGNKFIWESERDGWNHLYLYDMQGNLLQRVTEGKNPVTEIKAVDETNGWVYFLALGEDDYPYAKNLFRVNLKGGGQQRLTEGKGDRIVHISPSKEYFLDSHSTVSIVPQTDLRKTDGTLIQTISRANIDALKQHLQWSPAEEFKAKAADGETDLYGLILKPYNFDPSKKYPVVDYIYNGPHSTFFPLSIPGIVSNPEAALCHLGFVTLLFEGRGSSGRGKAFQDVTYGKLGQAEIEDHATVLKQLAEDRPYMDLDRVGIYGISYGGYMTLRAMLLKPDVYKAGVATAPLTDLEHAMAYTEHYMGLPKNNKTGYEEGSCITLAGNLKGKLLMIHATKDVNAPFSGTMKMAEAFIKAGKRFDLMILPDQPHVPFGDKGKYWLHFTHRYLQEHLLGVADVVSLWKEEKIEGKNTVLAQFTGEYDVQGYTVPVKFKDAETLLLSVPGQGEFELVHEKDTTFSIKDSPIPGLRVVFTKDDNGAVKELRLIQPNGDETVMKKK